MQFLRHKLSWTLIGQRWIRAHERADVQQLGKTLQLLMFYIHFTVWTGKVSEHTTVRLNCSLIASIKICLYAAEAECVRLKSSLVWGAQKQFNHFHVCRELLEVLQSEKKEIPVNTLVLKAVGGSVAALDFLIINFKCIKIYYYTGKLNKKSTCKLIPLIGILENSAMKWDLFCIIKLQIAPPTSPQHWCR